MKKLWAPWRMEYIEKNQNPDQKCIFCQKSKENNNDKQNYVISRKETGFSLLNIYPYSNGHLLIAPYRHTANLEDLTESELKDLMLLTRETIALLKENINPQGFNVGMNLGEIAGAGIAAHLHLHIVPRWIGDTNFMPVIGNTKVIPQSLEKMYNMLTRAK